MLPRVRGTLRSWSITAVSPSRSASTLATFSSPAAPCAQALVDWGSSESALASRPSRPVPHRCSIRSSCRALRRWCSLRAEAPALPASIGTGRSPPGRWSGGRGVAAEAGGGGGWRVAGGTTGSGTGRGGSRPGGCAARAATHPLQVTVLAVESHSAVVPAASSTEQITHTSGRRSAISFRPTINSYHRAATRRPDRSHRDATSLRSAG